MTLHPSVAAVRLGVRRCLADLARGAEPSARRVVAVACSGGADSTALLAATVFEGGKAGWHVVGVTVDHGLQEGSDDHTARVVERMAAIGAAETVAVRVTVESAGLGPEAAAREARYAVLEEVAERLGAAAVLLGHTRDDQAETVLLGLARGSGPRSLAGMRRGHGRYRRPLLDVARADTVTACQVEGLEVWDDPHNADPAYLRTRVRARVLPVLEAELGPGVAETLARTADQLRVDVEHLDDLAEQALAALPDPLSVPALEALPTAVRRRVLRRLALDAGAPAGELFHEHVLAVDALLTDWHGQKWIDLPGHLRAARRDDRLHFVTHP
ncbi:tRNA lysidine(34) synthetase TilS [Nocardioides bigeumensis]|uniref:tRNA(Ile)-lysidine synthase n=1 Tax=Nocardioides bigeumensis TaxID=433657 RepID=A0ABN2YTF0_9ACTN